MKLRPSCNCTSTILIRGGVEVACATCGAPILSASDSETIYGSRAPYPPPPGKTHRWLRDHGPDLVDLGLAERRGGLRGRGVLYLVSPSNLQTFEQQRRANGEEKGLQNSANVSANDVDEDSWIAASGHRLTKAMAR